MQDSRPQLGRYRAPGRAALSQLGLLSTGFKAQRGGAHTARTMMLAELSSLLDYCGETAREPGDFRQAIEQGNCLSKRSVKSRSLTFRHLADLYGLSDAQLVFRGLRYFWNRDPDGRPLMALCAALARDKTLADLAPLIWACEPGALITRQWVEDQIEVIAPERFSPATRKSVAQNINATLTQSGHLRGRKQKHRVSAQPTPGAVAYALLLSRASGALGPALFRSLYVRAMDAPTEDVIVLAEGASRRGWMRFNRLGEVMEVAFPDIINATELERLHEQD